jgi:predicted ester cyclase
MTLGAAPHRAQGADLEDERELALRSFALMEHGSLEDFEAVIHPKGFNREQKDEPPEARGRGPGAWYPVALWLRSAFADLRWETHDVVSADDLVVVHCTMSGRHVRDFVAYDENAEVDEVFPPTGKRFATAQTHWLRIADGKLVEHWANRDDLGMAKQLGWVPPTPAYLLRMALAARRARRAHRRGIRPWQLSA